MLGLVGGVNIKTRCVVKELDIVQIIYNRVFEDLLGILTFFF